MGGCGLAAPAFQQLGPAAGRLVDANLPRLTARALLLTALPSFLCAAQLDEISRNLRVAREDIARTEDLTKQVKQLMTVRAGGTCHGMTARRRSDWKQDGLCRALLLDSRAARLGSGMLPPATDMDS